MMVCFKHPNYNGENSPDLSCKNCCKIFVDKVKNKNTERAQDIAAWIESKEVKPPRD